MRTKIRLITTILSLSLVCICLVFGVSLSLKAASNIDISGGGGLSFTPEISIDDQKNILNNSGFHATGDPINLQRTNDYTSNTQDANLEAKNNAINNKILSFELYKKINCTQQEIYELQIVLDLSSFNIVRYAGEFLLHYNYVVFYTNESNYPINMYNFYSGENLGEYNLTLGNGGFSINIDTNNITYTYKIILNNVNYDNIDDLHLSDDCFDIRNGISINNQSNQLPNVIYLDFSNTNITIEKNNDGELILNGISYGSDIGSSVPPEGISLSNIPHFHIIGSTNSQYEAAMVLVKDYITSGHNNYEMSIYSKNDAYSYSILAKLSYSEGLVVDVIDNAYYSDSNLNDTQRKAILDMCYWVVTHLDNINIAIYHQKVNDDMSFNTSARYEVNYELDSSKGEGWYKAYYTSDNTLIGYFNSNKYQISFT